MYILPKSLLKIFVNKFLIFLEFLMFLVNKFDYFELERKMCYNLFIFVMITYFTNTTLLKIFNFSEQTILFVDIYF